jgi:HK97 family phage portal protein
MTKPTLWNRVRSFFFTNDAGTTLANPSADFIQSLLGYPTASGKAVTRVTAVRCASFLSCVRMLSSDIAKYPLILRQTTTKGGRVIRTAPAIDEPLYPILKDCPNQWQTSYQLRFFLASQLLTAGNCFAQIIRDKKGDVLALNPLDAWRMTQKWDLSVPGKPVLYWIYADGQGSMRRFEQAELWHTVNLNIEGGGFEGSAIIALAKESLSVLIAAEETAGRNFANGLGMSGFISAPPDTPLTEPQAQSIVDRLKKDFSGSQNAGKFTLLPGGLKWENMSYNARDSQLLESRQWNAEEIARLMGGAPLLVKLGLGEKNSTYAASSAFLEDYHNTSLLPHCTALEQSIKRDLIDRKDWNRLEATHDTSVILAGSLKERAETYSLQIASGQLTPNEARVKEDMDTIEGADWLALSANCAVFDPLTKEIYIPGQDLPGKDEAEEPAPPTDPEVQPEQIPPKVPPTPPAPKKKPKAAVRLESIALSLAERVRRKEEKSGSVDQKFVAEVLNVPLDKATEYCAKRTSNEITNETATAFLVALVVGENDDQD